MTRAPRGPANFGELIDPLLVRGRHGVDHAGEQIRDVELLRTRSGLEALLLSATFAHVDLGHPVVVNFREVHGRGIFPAHLTEHRSSSIPLERAVRIRV